MMFIAFEKNKEAKQLENNLKNFINCKKMASILNYIHLSPDGTELTTNLRQRLVTNGSFIDISPTNGSSAQLGQSCRFQGFVDNYNITGNIRISKTNGVITIVNT